MRNLGGLIKPLIPAPLKDAYRRHRSAAAARETRRVQTIDLRRTLAGGEGFFDAGQWARLIGDLKRASMVLSNTPHVRFLQAYASVGEGVFEDEAFHATPYFQNAMRCVQFHGSYFGQTTAEGIRDHARAFVRLYDRIRTGDPSEVQWPDAMDHSPPGALPIVRATMTPNTFQVEEGHHRMSVAWMTGKREIRAIVLRPPKPTYLQSLVLSVAQTQGRRELYQPIEGPEFDGTWGLVRRCRDRLTMMHRFLSERGVKNEGSSVVDLACSYGWFVSEFARAGWTATGVDRDGAPLEIGQIAYGLRADQLVQSDLLSFLRAGGRTFDVVLLLSVLHYPALNGDMETVYEILKRVDVTTGTCLFIDTGQSHEAWWRTRLPEWDDGYIIDLIRRTTSFSTVVPLGVDSDNVQPYARNYGRTLFACVRS